MALNYFGLDSEQQYSFLQVVEYFANARANEAETSPTIPSSMLSGFNVGQCRSLQRYFDLIWDNLEDSRALRITTPVLDEGFGVDVQRSLKRIAGVIAAYIESKSPQAVVNDWTPLDLGPKLQIWYDPADRSTLYTDFAMTTLALGEGSAIAAMADKSGHGYHAKKATVSARPLLYFLLGSWRRALNFDGVDDSLTTPVPDMGSSCVIARSLPSTGASILTNQTIAAGNLNQTLDSCGMVITNAPLTTEETAKLTHWLNEKAGELDEFNVAYGDEPAETLNVLHSSGHPKGPIMVMVHGGGWRNGDKAISNVVKNKSLNWLPQGFTFVTVGYTLDIGTDPIDQARSVAKALKYVQEHATEWGCDPRKIILVGHSAGGHLVALVTSSKQIQQEADLRPWLGTVGLDTAAYNVRGIMMNPFHQSLYDEPWGTDPAHWDAGSPVHQITEAPNSFMIIVSTEGGGEADGIFGQQFKEKIEALGGEATLYETPLLHGETNDLLGVPGAYTDAVEAFIDAQLA